MVLGQLNLQKTVKLGHYLTSKLLSRRIKVLPVKGKSRILSEDKIEHLHNLRIGKKSFLTY